MGEQMIFSCRYPMLSRRIQRAILNFFCLERLSLYPIHGRRQPFDYRKSVRRLEGGSMETQTLFGIFFSEQSRNVETMEGR
jgi:hypothetical protein